MTDSLQPHPWDSPGKNTGVGLSFPSPMHKSESEVAQSCPTSRPHGLQPTRLLRPWDFPGKSTGVECHCFLSYFENCGDVLDNVKPLENVCMY